MKNVKNFNELNEKYVDTNEKYVDTNEKYVDTKFFSIIKLIKNNQLEMAKDYFDKYNQPAIKFKFKNSSNIYTILERGGWELYCIENGKEIKIGDGFEPNEYEHPIRHENLNSSIMIELIDILKDYMFNNNW